MIYDSLLSLPGNLFHDSAMQAGEGCRPMLEKPDSGAESF
jgi:hypothetical protein